MDIASLLRTALSLSAVLTIFWFGIGGRRGLRNRFLGTAFIFAALSALTILIGHFFAPTPDRSGVEWIPIIATVIFIAAGLCAALLVFLIRQSIGDIVGRSKLDDPDGPMDTFESDLMAAAIGREQLLKLSDLLKMTRVAPGHRWLTREWVEAQLERLPPAQIES